MNKQDLPMATYANLKAERLLEDLVNGMGQGRLSEETKTLLKAAHNVITDLQNLVANYAEEMSKSEGTETTEPQS